MAKQPISDGDFSRLLNILISETSDNEKKFEKLYYADGCFSGVQVNVLDDKYFVDKAAALVGCFKTAPERVRVIRTLEKVSTHVAQELAAGGHQINAPVGCLFSQSFPGKESLYGPISEQLALKNHEVKPSLPVTVNIHPPPSAFTAAPSYAYVGDEDRSWYPGGGRPPLPPPVADTVITGPPRVLGESQVDFAASHPTYLTRNPCLTINQGGPSPIGFKGIQPLERTNCC